MTRAIRCEMALSWEIFELKFKPKVQFRNRLTHGGASIPLKLTTGGHVSARGC